MSNEHHSTNSNQGIWYTYFGKGGSAAFTFLWILIAVIWLFSVLKWG